jgi:hypothetical protein
VFVKLICDLPSTKTENVAEDSLPDESLFLINYDDIWYRDIMIYLQTQTFQPDLSSIDRRCILYQASQYIILDDTLYHRGVDTILRHCLVFDEVEKSLNDFHSGECGGHMYGYSTAQKVLRDGYFWPSLFKDCITII